MVTSSRAGLAMGLGAIALWSTSVGTLRGISEHLGPTGGSASLFTVCALLLFSSSKRRSLRDLPKLYLFLGGTLFVAYEVCYSLALGFARNRGEAIEVAMVNYLWPSLTVVCSAIAARQRISAVMALGLVVAFAGVVLACSPNGGLSLSAFISHAAGNPISYCLAFVGAVVWAVYCTLVRALARGTDGLWFFMGLCAAALWLLHAAEGDSSQLHWSGPALALVLVASIAMASGYAFWNAAVAGGNLELLAVAANGTPLLSALFASVWLNTPLSLTFWTGAALVVAGSVVAGAKARRAKNLVPESVSVAP